MYRWVPVALVPVLHIFEWTEGVHPQWYHQVLSGYTILMPHNPLSTYTMLKQLASWTRRIPLIVSRQECLDLLGCLSCMEFQPYSLPSLLPNFDRTESYWGLTHPQRIGVGVKRRFLSSNKWRLICFKLLSIRYMWCKSCTGWINFYNLVINNL